MRRILIILISFNCFSVFGQIEDIDSRLYEIALSLTNEAHNFRVTNIPDSALKKFKEANDIYKILALRNPDLYMPDVTTTLVNLGLLYNDKGNSEDAKFHFKEAHTIINEVAKKNPDVYLPREAAVLQFLANLQSETKEYEEALINYEESLSIYKNLAKRHPNIYLTEVATILTNLGTLHQECKDFELAIRKLILALSIRDSLAKDDPIERNQYDILKNKLAIIASESNIVYGKVTDLFGYDVGDYGLPFANVAISGLNMGTQTNFDGFFLLDSLEVDFPFSIDISYLGYKDTTVVVRKVGRIETIILNEETEVLGEVLMVGFEGILLSNPITGQLIEDIKALMPYRSVDFTITQETIPTILSINAADYKGLFDYAEYLNQLFSEGSLANFSENCLNHIASRKIANPAKESFFKEQPTSKPVIID